MADDGVVVKLGADTGDATSSMNDAQASIAASLKGIQSALEGFNNGHKKVVQEAVANNANLSRSFIELKDSINGGFNGAIGVIERFRGVLGSLVAVVAGGALFAGAIRSAEELEDSVRTLQQVFGMTAEKATQMSVNLKLAGVSTDTYAGMATKASRQLRQQNNEFDRLGVVTKDAQGNLLPMDQILENTYTTMQQYKAGTDQTLVSMSLLGRGSVEFAQDMQRVHATTALAKQMVHDLGIEMGPDKQAAVENYRIQVNAFKVTLDEIGTRVAAAVMPALGGLAAWFVKVGPTAITVVVDAVKVFIGILTALGTMIGVAAVWVTGFFENMATRAREAGSVTKAVVTGDWTAIPSIIAAANKKVEDNAKQTMTHVAAIWKAGDDQIKALFNTQLPTAAPGAPTGSGPKTYKAKDTSSGDDAIAQMKAELQAREDAYNNEKIAQGSFETWSTQQTLAYWANIIATTKATGKQLAAIQTEYYNADRTILQQKFAAHIAELEEEKNAEGATIAQKMAITRQEEADTLAHYNGMAQYALKYEKELTEYAKQQAKEDAAIQKEKQKNTLDMLKLEQADAKDELAYEVAERQITDDQKFAIEKQFLTQIHEAEKAAAEDELALLQAGTVAYQVQFDKILQMDKQFQNQMTQIDRQAEEQRQADAKQADQDFQSDFASALGSVIDGTKSLKAAFTDFFNSLEKQLSQIASNQIAKQLLGAGTSGGSAVDSLMSKIFGGGASGSKSASGGGQAANAAAVQADTTAMQTQTATLTTQNPILTTLNTSFTTLTAAAQQAAQALMQVGSSGGMGGMGGGDMDPLNLITGLGIPSFDVGTSYVPQDTLAYIHKGEAVVPAAMNRSSGGGGGMNVTQHIGLGGRVDTRTASQLGRAAYVATKKANARNG